MTLLEKLAKLCAVLAGVLLTIITLAINHSQFFA